MPPVTDAFPGALTFRCALSSWNYEYMEKPSDGIAFDSAHLDGRRHRALSGRLQGHVQQIKPQAADWFTEALNRGKKA